jgi:hypothetical protein
MPVNDNNQLQNVSLVNNRSNNRKIGRGGPGAPRMSKTTSSKETCKFCFVIKFDTFGYYIHVDRGSGQHMHNGHPKPMTSKLVAMPMRLMTDEMKIDARHAMNSQSNS